MAYVIAKKHGRNGSVAYTYDSADIQLISDLEQEYLNRDIDIFITSEICNKKEFLPVFNVGHFELFIESIKKVLK
ncbi:DUF6718 family protein [Alkalibacterium putridalgicola]|uniref:Uncharacterized protein n=1 Tax=Alkalibacterium putridalgicola TaxID=426703 RepID=A0A1H7SPJ2_9LACT|nr:DUF6718 family protein [Alkalibacterium putridalgicola]GEK89190.1 hypothetical protein APU01nite_12290 [Alkalibacterium putridalgicola]SEL74433.1 hypothetical protein SAMN04488100_10921 [Alkalibacterium putridalgicola]